MVTNEDMGLITLVLIVSGFVSIATTEIVGRILIKRRKRREKDG